MNLEDIADPINKYKKYYSPIEPFLRTPAARTYSSLILFFLTVSFFMFFAIRPTLNTIVTLNKQIEDGRTTEKSLIAKKEALSIAQSQYNKVENILPLAFTALPQISDVATFLKLGEGAARSSGISLTSLTMQSIDLVGGEDNTLKAGEVKPIGFNMSIQGTYSQIQKFINLMHSMIRFAVIDSVKVQTPRDIGAGLIVTISGNIFYQK